MSQLGAPAPSAALTPEFVHELRQLRDRHVQTAVHNFVNRREGEFTSAELERVEVVSRRRFAVLYPHTEHVLREAGL